MKNSIIITLLSSLFLFASCKKKETTQDTANNPTTTGGSTTGSTTGSTGGSDYYSTIKTNYIISNSAGFETKDSLAHAIFYSQPVSNPGYSLVSAGNVSLNSVNIPTIGGVGVSYFKQPINVNLKNILVWSISGSGTLTAFSHSLTPSFPNYTGGNLLQDSCSKSAGITINVSGVTNNISNNVIVRLNAGSYSSIKYILSSNGSVTFSAQDLAAFPTNQSLTIQLSMANLTFATYGGKKHGFSNGLEYYKNSYLKP